MPSKFNLPLFESSGTLQEVKVLHFPLMGMLFPRNFDEVIKLDHIWIMDHLAQFFSQHFFYWM